MKRNIIIGTLTAAVVLTLVFTCPGKKAHQAAIRNLITETLDEEPPEIIPQELLPVWNVLGSLAAGQLIDVLLDSQLEVRNYAIFSIGRIQLPDEKKTVSFGILGKIYTFDKEDIQKSWRKINQSGYCPPRRDSGTSNHNAPRGIHTKKSAADFQKRKNGCAWVIRLGFEPKTPTLKVLCSTS